MLWSGSLTALKGKYYHNGMLYESDNPLNLKHPK
jgi:hypothetical protein